MLNDDILAILKNDLLISTNAQDSFLKYTIETARRNIETEGITIQDTISDGMLIEMYAAHLYRTRREPAPMPRMLRWALNNRLLHEKGALSDG